MAIHSDYDLFWSIRIPPLFIHVILVYFLRLENRVGNRMHFLVHWNKKSKQSMETIPKKVARFNRWKDERETQRGDQ